MLRLDLLYLHFELFERVDEKEDAEGFDKCVSVGEKCGDGLVRRQLYLDYPNAYKRVKYQVGYDSYTIDTRHLHFNTIFFVLVGRIMFIIIYLHD